MPVLQVQERKYGNENGPESYTRNRRPKSISANYATRVRRIYGRQAWRDGTRCTRSLIIHETSAIFPVRVLWVQEKAIWNPFFQVSGAIYLLSSLLSPSKSPPANRKPSSPSSPPQHHTRMRLYHFCAAFPSICSLRQIPLKNCALPAGQC
ncbi:hypothetical protein OCU04_003754 [Sclerotinia nivalis]|uniref:Uncharacterized protein n=1 Tax=Sclerotinia nivalis TaxID=352851 RepID=A0A9X0ATD5_9HELO|nr:hypothetical protein OCU04_003754 [Sclerotinia nivalis]